ncbi:MAG: hypothetical protein ABEN55_08705 [Bradymonadaceae bacterium]
MSYEAQITELQTWHRVETTDGTYWLPADTVEPTEAFDPSVITGTEQTRGYGARFIDPAVPGSGTDWTAFDTLVEAFEHLRMQIHTDDELFGALENLGHSILSDTKYRVEPAELHHDRAPDTDAYTIVVDQSGGDSFRDVYLDELDALEHTIRRAEGVSREYGGLKRPDR